MIALASSAWLGPGYQVTSQVNVVRPGGKAQEPHRDYHLGFLTDEVIARYPTHVHALSPVLTLQGAVAHSDMPLESGPTLYLPYSHQYLPGYLAWRREDFKAYFAEHHVQLPLRKGDAGFFNPALFHGAGSNVSTDIQRMANLLQVSSAFGRAMEQVDRARVVNAVYPALRQSSLGADGLAAAVAAVRGGLPVPDQPRPRPAGRRADPGHPGRARAPRPRRGLGAGRADRGDRATTPRAGAPEPSVAVDQQRRRFVERRHHLDLRRHAGRTARQHPARLEQQPAGASHVGAQVVVEHRRDPPGAEQPPVVRVEVVGDEHLRGRPSSSKTSRMARLPPPIE